MRPRRSGRKVPLRTPTAACDACTCGVQVPPLGAEAPPASTGTTSPKLHHAVGHDLGLAAFFQYVVTYLAGDRGVVIERIRSDVRFVH